MERVPFRAGEVNNLVFNLSVPQMHSGHLPIKWGEGSAVISW